MTKQIVEKIDEDIGYVLSDADDVIGKAIPPKRSIEVRVGEKGEPSIVVYVK